MKNLLIYFSVAVLFALFFLIARPGLVRAQSFGGYAVGPIAPAVANCPAGVAGQAVYCPVGGIAGYATYVSYNALPYALLITPPAPAGVTGFGNPPRSGNVVLTKADITATGISASVPASAAPLQ